MRVLHQSAQRGLTPHDLDETRPGPFFRLAIEEIVIATKAFYPISQRPIMRGLSQSYSSSAGSYSRGADRPLGS